MRIYGFYGRCTLNFLRTLRTGFHSGCSRFIPNQQCTDIRASPRPCLPDGSHSNWCEMASRRGFVWHLRDDQ